MVFRRHAASPLLLPPVWLKQVCGRPLMVTNGH